MNSKPDHYAALGLARQCTTAQVRAAYRELVKRHHPDRNPDSRAALARSQELNEAHEVLIDPARRRAYDRERDATETAARTSRPGRIHRNISQDVPLRIVDFFRGTQLQVRVNDPGNPNGAEIYDLQVPPQTSPGTRFRIPRAEPFAGGFVVLRVRAGSDFRFKPRGPDLKCDLRISAHLAKHGGREQIAGPAGTQLRLLISPGVARGETLRVRGEGLPKNGGGRGDLLVRIIYRPEVRVSKAR